MNPRGNRLHQAIATGIALMLAGLAPASAREVKVETVTELMKMPGGLTITPKGARILSIHQFQNAKERVIRLSKDDQAFSFPNDQISMGGKNLPLTLDSVLGIKSDKKGVVWMLDNGRRSETTPKLVAWDSRDNELVKVIPLVPPATIPTSFLHDLAVDPEKPYIYISDPASGSDAAMIVVNTKTGLARRLLQGHYSVVPSNAPLVIDGRKIQVSALDGRKVPAFVGINPIAVDRKGEWVYFGPMDGTNLFRVATEHLRSEAPSDVVGSRVEGYAKKPITDSIAIDEKGNIYVSDLAAKGIGVIVNKGRIYKLYAQHPDFLWPDGLCIGPDGDLYFYASQLHKTAPLNAGRNLSRAPWQVFKIKTLTSGWFR